LMNQNFDVIVIGGGPAGSTAGYKLGQSGARVLLLDKANFPREKLCGGALSARLLDRFPYVRELFNRGEVPVNPVSRVHLEAPDGTRVTYRQVEPLLHLVRRGEFDVALFRRAQSVCTVQTGVTIRECTVLPTHVEASELYDALHRAKMGLGQGKGSRRSIQPKLNCLAGIVNLMAIKASSAQGCEKRKRTRKCTVDDICCPETFRRTMQKLVETKSPMLIIMVPSKTKSARMSASSWPYKRFPRIALRTPACIR
jgi:heterodisulfide reductase subunit A-like polyferredoxin